MNNKEIQNLIKELIEKTNVSVVDVVVEETTPNNTWFHVELKDPAYYVARDGEGLMALNHLVRRIVEARMFPMGTKQEDLAHHSDILIDINGFQKKRMESVRAIAHMMAERARYFKSSVEVDPMSSFERRIVHEFLATETDLKTESVGFGPARRVVIKYLGAV